MNRKNSQNLRSSGKHGTVGNMNRKNIAVFFLLTLAVLIGIPVSFAHPQYLTNLTAVYGDGSCGTCHVSASGGGPRNSYGTLFENQPDHATDPSAALIAIGQPPAAATLTEAPSQEPASTPIATEIPTETVVPEVTTVTATGTPTAPGFGIVISLVGIFACAFLARRHK